MKTTDQMTDQEREIERRRALLGDWRGFRATIAIPRFSQLSDPELAALEPILSRGVELIRYRFPNLQIAYGTHYQIEGPCAVAVDSLWSYFEAQDPEGTENLETRIPRNIHEKPKRIAASSPYTIATEQE